MNKYLIKRKNNKYIMDKPTDLTELVLGIKDYFGNAECEVLYPFCTEFNVLVIVEKITYNNAKNRTEDSMLNLSDITVFKHHNYEFNHVIYGNFEDICRFLISIVHNPDDTGMIQTCLPYAVFIDGNKEQFSVEKLENADIPLNNIYNFVRPLSSIDYDLNILENHNCYLYCDESNHCLETNKKTLSYQIPRLNNSNYIKGNCVIVGNSNAILKFLNNTDCLLRDEIIHHINNLINKDNNGLNEFLSMIRTHEPEVQLDEIIYNIL